MDTQDNIPKNTAVLSLPDFLVRRGVITQDGANVLQAFLSLPTHDNKEDINTVLVDPKLAEEESLAQALADFFTLPYTDLRGVKSEDAVLSLIPQEALGFYNFAPFALDNGTLKVAIADPTNLQALQALEFLGQKQGLRIELFTASRSSIRAALGQSEGAHSAVDQALVEFQRVQASETRSGVALNAPPSVQILESAPIVKIVDVVLGNAVEAGASDIHLEPSENDVRVRYRVDGVMHDSLTLPKHVHTAVVSRIKILSNLKIDESRLPQDGRFHFSSGKKSVDVRVSILPLIYGEKVVMRILDKSTSVPTLEQLGLWGEPLAWVLESIKKSHGIFLITGPTGSGKSTTLYSILSLLNTDEVNIVTMEDPVEYFIPGVNQSQINAEIGLTFASGLRSILRQDPDVVMVGEVRDRETADLAVHAALTGHLVFSTLHTNNAVGAVPRLVDMDIEPFLLAASMNMVIAQRLVRKVCANCKQASEFSPAVWKDVQAILSELPEKWRGLVSEYVQGTPKEYKGQGCNECGNTGYRGRVGIFEVLNMNARMQDLIITKVPASVVEKEARSAGMISMRQDGIIKVLRGETTYEEVVRATSE